MLNTFRMMALTVLMITVENSAQIRMEPMRSLIESMTRDRRSRNCMKASKGRRPDVAGPG